MEELKKDRERVVLCVVYHLLYYELHELLFEVLHSIPFHPGGKSCLYIMYLVYTYTVGGLEYMKFPFKFFLSYKLYFFYRIVLYIPQLPQNFSCFGLVDICWGCVSECRVDGYELLYGSVHSFQSNPTSLPRSSSSRLRC